MSTENTTDDTENDRFSLIEIEDDKESQGEVRLEEHELFPLATPAPVAPVVRGVTVDAEGAARATEDERYVTAQGFAVAPPLYTIGTMVVQLGVENFKASRNEWEQMPLVGEACADLVKRVKAEERKDTKLPAKDLVFMKDNGMLHTVGNGTYPMSERGFEGLCQHVTPGGAGFLKACPTWLRGDNLNHWLQQAYRLDKRATDKAMAQFMIDVQKDHELQPPAAVMTPKEVTLRTRKMGDSREIFSVVGPRYGVHDVDSIAEQIATGLAGTDARCDLIYDGYKAKWTVLYHSNIKAEKAVAGEIFKAGIVVKTADDGSGAIHVNAVVWRNLCLNLIIIDEKWLKIGSRRHMGASSDIANDVAGYLKTATDKIGLFVNKWSQLSVEDVVEKYAPMGITDVEGIFTRLVENKVVHVPGMKPADMVQRLVTAWDKEPFRTTTGIINAVTRAAHEDTWTSPWTTSELEETAGNLVFQKVWDMQDRSGTAE